MIAAEQKARATYDNILRLSDDPDVNNVIRFLREREVVHFQRFGEALGLVTEKLNQNNVYYMNPAFPDAEAERKRRRKHHSAAVFPASRSRARISSSAGQKS